MANNMQAKLIETYSHKKEGYNPFLIRKGWQVAQLNYIPEQGLNSILKIEVHPNTDEALILLTGTAVLIAAARLAHNISYEMTNMEQGIVYNIPKGTWHNIAMKEDTQVIIIENDNTHQNDFGYYYLDEEQKTALYQQIANELK